MSKPYEPPPLPPVPTSKTATLTTTLADELAIIEQRVIAWGSRRDLDAYRLKRMDEEKGCDVSYTPHELELADVPRRLIDWVRDDKWKADGFPGLDPKRLEITSSHSIIKDRSPSGRHDVFKTERKLTISVWIAAGAITAGLGTLGELALHLWRMTHGGNW